MKLPDRSRAGVLGAAVLLVLLAAWLLLVPVTAVYEVSAGDATPREVSTSYSWWTREQTLIYPNVSFAWDRPIDPANVLEGHRLSCGNSLTTGEHENREEPSGPAACAEIETPRRVFGIGVLLLGLLGLVAATRLPDPRRTTRYRRPYRQRRALGRGR